MNISRLSGRLGALVRSFAHDRRGNYAIIAAITSLPLLTSVAVAIEYANASRMRSELQQRLDAAVLAGASHGNAQVAEAERFFRATFQDNSENQSADGVGSVIKAGFSLGEGVLDGWASRPMEPMFGFGGLTEGKEISVVSQARFLVSEAAAPCITVLANKTQALLVNSGAKIDAERCEVNVHSTEHNAMIMNAQSSLDVSRTCVAGKSILNNGGRIGGLEIGCRPPADPYAGKIPEPTLPASCTTSGPKSPGTHTLKSGMHCDVTFNGTANVTFEPGLHIVRGTMIINAGTVKAEGVTFYFPNTQSRIQLNDNITMSASAPASGPYQGILMFERTSDPSNNSHKQQFVFNRMELQRLEGAIYLPNRDVTYNAKSNINGHKTALVVNTLIINQADWKLDGLTSAGAGQRSVYLSR